ncbi:hypothetical protein [Caulobacter sp. DWP3-1-3b2]|uniref:hypothetical protein n=1 Tax=Caulobacter sp. DWP3-1-3b2 TaxID=2804643 RepID=UPI003CF3AC83
MIINADCDLANRKTDGVVAILPIYPFDDYLAQFWAPGHVAEVAAQATQSVLDLIDDEDGSALQDWLRDTDAEQVADALTQRAGLKKAQALKLVSELERLAICLAADKTFIARFKELCRAAQNPQAYARTQITSAKKTMGEGHFFISDLVDHPAVGFVIRMRRIYTLPDQDLFTSTSAQRSGSGGDQATAVRVARLTPLYQFKVLQVFAQQYSRIGLPDEISALGTLAIDDLVATFTGAAQ